MGMRARQLLSISIVAAGRPSASWCVAGVLQCVAACCKCVAVRHSVLRSVNRNEGETVGKYFHRGGGASVHELVCCRGVAGVLQHVALCCSGLQVCCSALQWVARVLQCVTVCCGVSIGMRARQLVSISIVAAGRPSAS